MHYITIFIAFLVSSCVTVQVGTQKPNQAKGVEFVAPPAQFSELKTESADRAWQSEKTGNVIAYRSECLLESEPTLEKLTSDALTSLETAKILSQDRIQFNSREALLVTAKGFVDGVPVVVSVLGFKKNSCSYVLSYNGTEKYFEVESNYFHNFKESFRAP